MKKGDVSWEPIVGLVILDYYRSKFWNPYTTRIRSNVMHEYHEGPEAAEKFEKMAKKIFRAPKSTAKPVPKKHAVRKAKKASKVSAYVYRAPAVAQRDVALPTPLVGAA